ncbi:ribose 5-phosphate isomerase A [Hyperthermus butylicus]|uniref:Ribose 5-phosphate isomerase A n=1 Tax=Hyperthermus butylicus (strain DSM 5456 / JCM 9403 / PLM1-5) TaxID=415426 RepID=A2BLS3_HYPBU|nr:ribose 5-phosphate isomerase A [Hyperthermus butylicus]ABM80934.1 ribose-5-phosphate isomerase A [Hyperthermus butylicus DSM 5456]
MTALAKVEAARRAAEILEPLIERAERIGIGTGSTVRLVLRFLIESPAASALRRAKVYASSFDTLLELRRLGIEAYDFLPRDGLDVYFDGADEVARVSDMCMAVKGRGAAMLREKLLAFNSAYTLLVVDESKVSRNLGDKGKPVPVEVVPPAVETIVEEFESRGIRAEVRTNCSCRDGPAFTDNYGIVIDTWPWGVMSPIQYESLLDTLPGVMGHGLFIGYMDAIVVGYGDGRSEEWRCRRTRLSAGAKARRAER